MRGEITQTFQSEIKSISWKQKLLPFSRCFIRNILQNESKGAFHHSTFLASTTCTWQRTYKKRQKHMYYRYGTPASQCEECNTTTGWKGCHNKTPQTGWVKQQILFLQFWKLSSRTKWQQGWLALRLLSLGYRRLPSACLVTVLAILSHPASRHVQTSLSNRDNCQLWIIAHPNDLDVISLALKGRPCRYSHILEIGI